MSAAPKLLIGRCSFWPEARDPEAWLRALVALSNAAAQHGTSRWTSPRAVGESVLRGHLSRRGAPGLFGLCPSPGAASQDNDEQRSSSSQLLHGVGLLEQHSDPSNPSHSTWRLAPGAGRILSAWQTGDHRDALEQLAALLLSRSVWLRLALLRLHTGTWRLAQWDKLKASNGQLRVGKTLLLDHDTDPSVWLKDVEKDALGAWWPQLPHNPPVTVQIHAPKTAKSHDGLSLSPLKSPLYLLDSLGWLNASGRLHLPKSLAHDPYVSALAGPNMSATLLMEQTMAAFSDVRGVFPLEPVMLRFAQSLGLFPHPAANDSAFITWMDDLLSESFRVGALELFSAEPGQPRHGRGLLGDPRQKLLRWRVHPGFDALCASVALPPYPTEPATAV